MFIRAAAVALSLFAIAAEPLAAQTIERLQETEELRLGFRIDAAPLSFLGDNNQPQGYAPLICTRIAEMIADDMGLQSITVNFIPVTTENRFEKVANDEIDLLCGAATITLARREMVDFSIPIFVDGTAVLMPAGGATDLAELAGQSIGVRAGTTTEQMLINTLETAGIAATVVTFGNHQAGIEALGNEEIAAYFGDQSILYGLLGQTDMAERFAISENTLSVEKHGLALRRGDADFRLAVDHALSRLYANGAMEESFRASFPGATPGVALRALFLIGPELP
ncbi:MAG: amino acid ABC transporter substrate-binding protein [Pseudomonadota bacterium]